jgi:hypothetical protein
MSGVFAWDNAISAIHCSVANLLELEEGGVIAQPGGD